MNFLVVSENAARFAGGAELSLRASVLHEVQPGDKIIIVCAQGRGPCLEYKATDVRVEVIQLRKFQIPIIEQFFLVSALISILTRIKSLSELIADSDIVISQNRWAPYIYWLHLRLAKRGHSNVRQFRVYIRDEKCLQVFRCYSRGLRKVGWYARHLLEWPFRAIHKAMVKNMFNGSKVIFNSNFMRSLARRENLVASESVVEYPTVERIDKDRLKISLQDASPLIKDLLERRDFNVVLVGSELVKGVEIFRRIARSFPALKFIMFGKSIDSIEENLNLVQIPWSKIRGLPYALAKTVVVPSIWLEAYGRVVVEAKQFNCNIVVSDQGGLVEALGSYEKGFVCSDYNDFVRSLEQCL